MGYGGEVAGAGGELEGGPAGLLGVVGLESGVEGGVGDWEGVGGHGFGSTLLMRRRGRCCWSG